MRASIYRIVLAQFLITCVASILCLLIDLVSGYSVFLGGLTITLPNAYMAFRIGALNVSREFESGMVAKDLVRAEVGKLALTAVIYFQIFYWIQPLAVGFYFAAVVMGMLCHVLVPLLDARSKLRHMNRR